MTGPNQFELLDFKNPRKPKKTKWRALSKWHESMCVLVTESWNALLTQKITLSSTKVEPFQCRAALQQISQDRIGVHFDIASRRFPSLVVFSRRQLHGLLADIWDLPGEEWPEVRAFTPAEKSILDVMFQGMADAISEAIPGPEATSCVFVEMLDRPERTRLFTHVDEGFVGEIKMTSRFGEDTAYWFLPRIETEELIGQELHDEDMEDRKLHVHLASLAQRINVDVVVELGQCDVSMSQVSQLCVGDVLVLEQSIHRPLTAYVGGERKWLGKPLRVGPRQGFEVVQLITD